MESPGQGEFQAVEGLIARVGAEAHVARPCEGVEDGGGWLVLDLELGIQLLADGEEHVGEGGAGEAGDKPDCCELHSLVDESADPVQQGVVADFEHVAGRAGCEQERKLARGLACGGRGRQEVHESEVEDGSDDDGGEDEVELVETEVGAGCHVPEDARGHPDDYLGEHLEPELRVGSHPPPPSLPENFQKPCFPCIVVVVVAEFIALAIISPSSSSALPGVSTFAVG